MLVKNWLFAFTQLRCSPPYPKGVLDGKSFGESETVGSITEETVEVGKRERHRLEGKGGEESTGVVGVQEDACHEGRQDHDAAWNAAEAHPGP